MELVIAAGIGVLVACGVYLVLRARTFSVALGLALISHAVNLMIFTMGRLETAAPPIIAPGIARYADPLPQALVLTAIVIGFGMTALVLVLALRAHLAQGSDHVDGREDEDTSR